MPLAVTMASAPIFGAHWSDDRARMFYHSSSYTANPIACAAAAANLAVWREEPVQERIDLLAARQAEGLAKLGALPGVSNPRQCGTIVAIDIGGGAEGYLSTQAPRLLRFFRENDVLLRPLGNTVYAMPPFCIEEADLRRVHEVMAGAAESSP
jgi:adenosylmethionine-8-amino-7-oxononanoate aminotransferase